MVVGFVLDFPDMAGSSSDRTICKTSYRTSAPAIRSRVNGISRTRTPSA